MALLLPATAAVWAVCVAAGAAVEDAAAAAGGALQGETELPALRVPQAADAALSLLALVHKLSWAVDGHRSG